jgi:hypothetical protein
MRSEAVPALTSISQVDGTCCVVYCSQQKVILVMPKQNPCLDQRQRFPLPQESDISNYEREMAIELPPRYRKFVSSVNGGIFHDCLIDYDASLKRDPLLLKRAGTKWLQSLHGLSADGRFGWQDLRHAHQRKVVDEDGEILLIGSTIDESSLYVSLDGDDSDSIYLITSGVFWVCESIDEFMTLLRHKPG